ncbi:MAG: class I SAM-dependent methyltransferase [Thermoanaerobaculia bacterium]
MGLLTDISFLPRRAATKPAAGPPRHRRFLSEEPGRREAWLQAAREYVSRKSDGERDWLYSKPYDASPGHAEYFHETYALLNLLGAMAVPFRGRILEVGSGPGWISEILMTLGYEVVGIEPSEEMIAIARERVEAAVLHYRLASPPRVTYLATTIEDCDLPDESFDAVLFHAALHHVIDEERTLSQCFRLLRPGGVLGVSEAAWIPGDRVLEEQLEEEMRRFGTLENPFTTEYLDWLLNEHGFVDVRRYHGINGWFPERMGPVALEALPGESARKHNNLTARRPSPYPLTTLDRDARTLAEITVLDSRLDADGLRLRVRLDNRGDTAWLHRAPKPGRVTIALRSGDLEADRQDLPKTVPAGGSIELDLLFRLPEGTEGAPWELDLVNEELFWFSERGTRPVRVTALPLHGARGG